MPVEHLYLLTATAFRLGVVISGTITTYLGYRLLSRSLSPRQLPTSTDATARLGNYQFALRKMTPGAVFALFGMCMIAIMIYEGTPEYRQETRQGSSTLTMRSAPTPVADASLRAADELLRVGKVQQARQEYENYFQTLATATNNFAWTLLQQSRTDEAVVLSRLATSLSPGEEHFMATYTEALEQAGQKADADKVIQREMKLKNASIQDARSTGHEQAP